MNINEAFATPKADLQGQPNNNTILTEGAILHLKRTRIMVLFLSILGFLLTTFMAFATYSILFDPVSTLLGSPNGFSLYGNKSVAYIYLAFTLIYFLGSLFLFQYSASVKKLLAYSDSQNLEIALRSQSRIWILVSILGTITLLAILVPTIWIVMSTL